MAYIYIDGRPIKEMEHLSNLQQGIGATNQMSGYKRSANTAGGSDDEDSRKSKTMDIYKQRQYKKLMQNT